MGYNAAPLERLIEQFAKLPGIGRKGATRLEYQVLSMDKEEAITEECQIKKETDYYYYGEGNTVQVMVALLISVISALIMLGLYIFGFTNNGVMLSQFRDLMCTSIGFLLGEAKIKSKN